MVAPTALRGSVFRSPAFEIPNLSASVPLWQSSPMNAIRQLWQRITRTKYARELEFELARQGAEIDRLRTENRALLNSILGVAGIPPLTIPAQSHSESVTRPLADDDSIFRPPPPANHAGQKGLPGPGIAGLPGRRLVEPGRSAEPGRSDSLGESLHSEQSTRPRNDSLHSSPRMHPVAPPHRRRSWHQINRILEIESARKPVASG